MNEVLRVLLLNDFQRNTCIIVIAGRSIQCYNGIDLGKISRLLPEIDEVKRKFAVSQVMIAIHMKNRGKGN